MARILIAETDNLTMVPSIEGLTGSLSRILHIHIRRPTARTSKNLISVADEQLQTAGQATVILLNSPSTSNKATNHWWGQD